MQLQRFRGSGGAQSDPSRTKDRILAASASFDHRIIDGAIGARFIAAVRARGDDPWSICR